MDLNSILGPYKFSLRATLNHHGNSIHCDLNTSAVNCCGKHLFCNDNRITEFNTIDTTDSLTVYILLYKLIVKCPWPDRGGWESLNSHGAGTFVYTFNYRSRNKHYNLWDRQCVSCWWPLDWFGYTHELYIDTWYTIIKSLTDWVCYLFVLTSGERNRLWWPALPGTGCPVQDVANIHLIWNVRCMSHCFYHCFSIGCFRPWTFFLKNGLD